MTTKAACFPLRPPRPACWLNSQVSLGRPDRNHYYCHPKTNPPMLTARPISGISHPMPAHFVLIKSLQSLNDPSDMGRSISKGLPSPQPWQDTLLLFMGVVPTELFNMRRLEAWKVERLCLLHCPGSCRIIKNWSKMNNSSSLIPQYFAPLRDPLIQSQPILLIAPRCYLHLWRVIFTQINSNYQ